MKDTEQAKNYLKEEDQNWRNQVPLTSRSISENYIHPSSIVLAQKQTYGTEERAQK